MGVFSLVMTVNVESAFVDIVTSNSLTSANCIEYFYQSCSSTLISYYFLLLVLERQYSGIFVVVDLISASTKEEGGQHVHGWENRSLVVEKEAADKLG